nr:MAG TPA: hypothetical protein [Caudoviricetes sp.]
MLIYRPPKPNARTSVVAPVTEGTLNKTENHALSLVIFLISPFTFRGVLHEENNH